MKRIFFVDGACSSNPGPGGYAVVEMFEGTNQIKSYTEDCGETTNNREELKALLYVVQLAVKNPNTNFLVYSDSAYAINSITNWMYGWARNGWVNSKKKPVENMDLMKQFYELMPFPLSNLTIEKVSGHTGLVGNELADALASRNKTKYLNLIRKNNLVDF